MAIFLVAVTFLTHHHVVVFQLAFLLSYVAVSWPCSWSEFNVSGIASISVVCFTERKRELGNEVGGGGGGMGPGPSSPYF